MEYRGYKIYENDYRDARNRSADFLFHNLNDCDENVGCANSVVECLKQINDIVDERESEKI